MSWFTNLRKIALITFISAVLGVLIPAWNAIHTILGVASENLLWRVARIPAVVLGILFTAIIPVFCFALYQNETPLLIPKRLRLLALLGALVDGVMLALALSNWVLSLGAYWEWMKTLDWRIGGVSILRLVRDPGTIGQLSFALNVFSDGAYVLLLIAIFRQQSDRSETGAPISRLLSLVTKIAVIALGLVVFAALLGLLLTPYTFYTLRKYAFQIGRTPPAFLDLLLRQIRITLEQACLFAAPYIVYRSQRERLESPVKEQPGPELLESGA